MNKYTEYDGLIIESVCIQGKAYASMINILDNIIPGSWEDYKQILNSSDSLIDDLGILHLPEDTVEDVQRSGYFIPVFNVSQWLYSISIKDSSDDIKALFRMYRRDCESTLRVTWAMDVDDIVVHNLEWLAPDFDQYSIRCMEYGELFRMNNIPVLPSVLDSGKLLDIIHDAAASNLAGDAGKNLVTTIEYIEELPLGSRILNYIDDCIVMSKVETSDIHTIFSMLDKTISFLATHFVGEKRAKQNP
tara:strand:+ start:69 stop:809 length:741 start_codon:yes stop_codon:yes gene_type:complete